VAFSYAPFLMPTTSKKVIEMDETLKKLEFERGQLAAKMKEINDAAEKEKRSYTAEESANWDKAYEDFKAKKDEIEKVQKEHRTQVTREQRMLEVQKELADGKPSGHENRMISVPGMTVVKSADRDVQTDEQVKELRSMELFNTILLKGGTAEVLKEYRDLQKTNPTKGGYLMAPIKMVMELIQDLNKVTKFRQYARVLPPLTDAVSLGFPTMPNKMTNFAWSGELNLGAEDTSMKFGRREFTPNPFSMLAKISEDLLRGAAIAPDSIVRGELQRVADENQEQAFFTGDGDKKPMGLFTTAGAGALSTAIDVATDNTTTSPTFDGLIECKYSLKPGYRMSSKIAWMGHSDFFKKVMKLKDLDNQYVWQQSVVAGQPDRLLNIPCIESEFCPNTFTTGQYVALLGDFDNYWIVDVIQMEIKILDQLYAATNEIGYKARGFVDGQPIKEEAFRRVKLG
jgi:HK97 family phage major capsid protein